MTAPDTPTIDNLPAICADLQARLLAKTGGYDWEASVYIFASPTDWSVSLHGSSSRGVGRKFRAPTLPAALAAAYAWLDFDEAAAVNATLGLAPDGLLMEARDA